MSETERRALKTVAVEREEIAFKRLKNKPQYMEICKRQNKTSEMVEALYDRLKKEERITIRCHFEGETEKEGMEFNEVYIQGMRDCFSLLSFLDVFNCSKIEL